MNYIAELLKYIQWQHSPEQLPQALGLLQDMTGVDFPSMAKGITGPTPEDLTQDLSSKINGLLTAVIKQYNINMAAVDKAEQQINDVEDLYAAMVSRRQELESVAYSLPFYSKVKRQILKEYQSMDVQKPDTSSVKTGLVQTRKDATKMSETRDALVNLQDDLQNASSRSAYHKASAEWRDQYDRMYKKYYDLLGNTTGNKEDS